MFCPKCGKKDETLEPNRSAFVEAGDWEGRRYEDECSVQEYQCPECGHLWYE